MGCDALQPVVYVDKIVVSIHAPVWGATVCGMDKAALELFQSTHPYGVRQVTIISISF